MITIDPLEAKIIKQIEYYFSDLNLSRDKFMKQVMADNDGWISLETMLKFNRLKSLSDDIDVVEKAISKSTSGLLELGPNGIRRSPSLEVPENYDVVFSTCKDRCVYVKGFDSDATLDEIIEWLESVGGKTLNIYMRRLPKDKKFKGSIFAIFETKEDCEKFLSSSEAATYKGTTMTRMSRDDYWDGKKNQNESKLDARAQKKLAATAHEKERLASRMITGVLLELSGLPDAKGHSKGLTEEEESDALLREWGGKVDVLGGTTVIALKHWIVEKLGSDYPIAWIDVEPAAGTAIVRFKSAGSAEAAWMKLQNAFDGKPVIYANCELSGRVLTGDAEIAHWKTVLAAQLYKAQKRKGARQPGRGGGGFKRRRMN